MTHASKKEIKEHAQYMQELMSKILRCVNRYDESAYHSMDAGTIKNLSPELSKAASHLNKMMRYGFKK